MCALAGKEDPVEFDSSLVMWGDVTDVAYKWEKSLKRGTDGNIDGEIPPPLWSLRSSDDQRRTESTAVQIWDP